MVRVLRFRVWGLWFKFQIGNNHRRFLFDYRFLNSSTRPGSVKYKGFECATTWSCGAPWEFGVLEFKTWGFCGRLGGSCKSHDPPSRGV